MNKKRFFMSLVISMILVMSFIISGCGKSTDAVLKVGDSEVSQAEYMYYLFYYESEAEYLSEMYTQYNFGDFWTSIDETNGKTNKEVYYEHITEAAVYYTIFSDLATKAGITLDEETLQSLSDASSSMIQMIPNSALSKYGFTVEGFNIALQKQLLTQMYIQEVEKQLSIDTDAIAASINRSDYVSDADYESDLTDKITETVNSALNAYYQDLLAKTTVKTLKTVVTLDEFGTITTVK